MSKVLEHFTLYETRTRFYLIGSNDAGSINRVLKIDRGGEPPSLDPVEYSPRQLEELLTMIGEGNKSQGGLNDVLKNFFGLAGVVRFLEGPYLACITARVPSATLGGRTIYAVDDLSLIPVFQKGSVQKHPDEARYLQIFGAMDKNFYFSPSYDLTNSLQTNMEGDATPNDMFIWNAVMLERLGSCEGFGMPLVHGFLDQRKINLFGRPLFLTILARRSRFYSGPRFLKRGVNDQGYVANEVETEQILHSSQLTPFAGDYSSYVQHRGSIPLFWSQDAPKSPKPPIAIDFRDPFYAAAGMHFARLIRRFGSPIIVLNLVKQREVQPRESLVGTEFAAAIDYLNQFLAEDERIEHVQWDMARALKSDGDVIMILQEIAEKIVAKTGIYCSGSRKQKLVQRGVSRTNCIDCLDRTNAAQFVIAKAALGRQLYALGIIPSASLPFDTEAVRVLNSIYQDHGDTIALQYGGSQLVNTVDTYRKTTSWRNQSRDMIENLRRFYSNSFTDAEKQQAINLFLGNFVPAQNGPRLWDLPSDAHLHNSDPSTSSCQFSYRNWYQRKPDPPANELRTNDSTSAFSDSLDEHYRPWTFTALDQMVEMKMKASGNPDGVSPFAVSGHGSDER